jgi:hypothetical protein
VEKKIIKIPISFDQRKRNQKGEGYVPCEISDRYLNFYMESDVLNSGEFISVDVMTENTKDGKDRRITSLIITRENLLEVLNKIKPKLNLD